MSSVVINTPEAPAAIGPYVQARKCGNTLYLAGCVAIDPHDPTKEIEGIVDQTKQVLKNMGNVLKAAEFEKEDVIKTNVYLLDMNDFGTMNKLYEEFFGEHKPCRTCIQAGKLPKAFKVEIDCIAMKP